MALVTTPGAADADSYATVAEFDTYWAARTPKLTWIATATNDQKEAALRTAAWLLDSLFTWTGTAVDATQALTWPRSGMLNRNGFAIPTTVNPGELKRAQCEFAGQLGAGDRLVDNAALKAGVTSVKAGSVAVSFKEIDESADETIRRMGSDLFYVSKTVPDAVRQLLVPGWYVEASIKRPFIFGAM